jgi:hypothetical protein
MSKYLTEIKYSYGMLDCGITEKGMGQVSFDLYSAGKLGKHSNTFNRM